MYFCGNLYSTTIAIGLLKVHFFSKYRKLGPTIYVLLFRFNRPVAVLAAGELVREDVETMGN